MLNFFISLVTALFILYYIFDGYTKGALYMFIYMVRLFGSFFLTRYICSFLAPRLMNVSQIRSTIFNFTARNIQELLSVPGVLTFISGNDLTSAIEPVAQWILYMLCFIVVFIALMLLFSYLLKISRIVNKIPVVGCINRVIGGFEGLIYGALFTFMILYLSAFLFSLFGETGISQAILSSWLIQNVRMGFSWI